MTKKSMYRWVVLCVAWFVFVIITGCFVYKYGCDRDLWFYRLYKDIIPICVSLPLAWLSFCIQRRMSYLQQLRVLWSKLVDSVQESIQYTHKDSPSREEYAVVLKAVSTAIEEVRGVFRNVDAKDDKRGFYPFEPLKDIYSAVSGLGYGELFKADCAKGARGNILKMWEIMRFEILKEFDREVPTWPIDYWNLNQKFH